MIVREETSYVCKSGPNKGFVTPNYVNDSCPVCRKKL